MKTFEVWITSGFCPCEKIISGTVAEICNRFIQDIENIEAECIYEEDRECMLSMLEEIADADDPVFLQWYLDGTVAWHLLVTGTYEVAYKGYSLYGLEAVKQFVYA